MKVIAEWYLFSAADPMHYLLLFVFPGIFQRFWQPRTPNFPKYPEQIKGSSGELKGTAQPDLKEEISRVKRVPIIVQILMSLVEIIIMTSSAYLPCAFYDIHLAIHPSRFSGYTNLLLNVGEHILPIQKLLNESNVGFNLPSLNIFSF